MIRTILIDDEAPARMILKDLLKVHEKIEIVDECANGFEALQSIQKNKPDLIFLDIQMPKINGFELLEVLDEMPQIIFVTAYSEFAVKAFEANALDYLLKPVNEKRLEEAISKLKSISNIDEAAISRTKREMHPDIEKDERVVVKSGQKIVILEYDDILWIEADDDYIKIHSEDQSYLKKQTMKSISEELPQRDFLRVHRSHIINSSFLDKISPMGKETYLAILKNGMKIPVSQSGYTSLKKHLNF